MMSTLSDADRLVAEAQRIDDYEWALDRVTRMCASALVDAQVYRRALNIILAALQQAQTPLHKVTRQREYEPQGIRQVAD